MLDCDITALRHLSITAVENLALGIGSGAFHAHFEVACFLLGASPFGFGACLYHGLCSISHCLAKPLAYIRAKIAKARYMRK